MSDFLSTPFTRQFKVDCDDLHARIAKRMETNMSMTVNLDIPRTAEERLAREANSICALIKRIEARASDGRFYHLEDEDREKAIAYLKGYAKTHSKVLADVKEMMSPKDGCDHEWREIDSQSDNAVKCTKCNMAGERQRDGSVYWPAT